MKKMSLKKLYKKLSKRVAQEPVIKINKRVALGMCLGLEIVVLLALVVADYQLRMEIDEFDQPRPLASEISR